MSTDPSGLRKDKTCIEALNTQYIKVSFGRSDWCSYPIECPIDNTSTYLPEELCLLCEHRRPLNIPEILNRIKKENENESK